MYNQDIIRVKDEEPKSRKKPTINNLPDGANDDNAWTHIVIPSFLKLVVASDNPWMYKEADIKPLLQKVCNYTYGRSLTLDINKGSIPYEIVSPFRYMVHLLTFFIQAYQKLCQYRNTFASKAIDVTFAYYRAQNDNIANFTEEQKQIADWAHKLKASNDFIYKRKGKKDVSEKSIISLRN
jgi:hypothetical protein